MASSPNVKVCAVCCIVFDSELEFCSPKCQARAGFKSERKRRAELFAKHNLTAKTCGLNKFPAESCGMFANITEHQLPDGTTTLTIDDFCGNKHYYQGGLLAVMSDTELKIRAAALKLEHQRATAVAKGMKLARELAALRGSSKL